MLSNAERETARAKRTLKWSRVFLWAGVLVGLIAGIAIGGPVVASNNGTQSIILVPAIGIICAVAAGYQFWSIYWGWIWAWRSLLKLTGGVGWFETNVIFSLIAVVLLWYIVFTIAHIYGFFGGGFYQWNKAKRLVAASQAPTQPSMVQQGPYK